MQQFRIYFLSFLNFTPSLDFKKITSSLSKAWLLILFVALTSCGGGGGGSGGGNSGGENGGGGNNNAAVAPAPDPWQMGVFEDADNFAALCATPRVGLDSRGIPFPDMPGTSLHEKNFLRSWSNDTYLWYDELPDIDPDNGDTPVEYFEKLITSEPTAAGTKKDRYHFSNPTADWQLETEAGVSATPSYGAYWVVIDRSDLLLPPQVRVLFVEPGSPAANAGLKRGHTIISVDGLNLDNVFTEDDADIVIDGLLAPLSLEEEHDIEFQDEFGINHPVTMTTTSVVSAPVHTVETISTETGDVGYILFNDHNSPAEAALIDAINQFNSGGGIADLVLDLRYNSGGRLAIASQLAYMIAGPANTVGKDFEILKFNDKHLNSDIFPFIDYIIDFVDGPLPEGNPLPVLQDAVNSGALGLSRVFVLTSEFTCSASESIINGLRGADVEVIQIGSTTCGKPYGFNPQDNCGTTYFTIQFQSFNDKGFGEYTDGFAPENPIGTSFPAEAIPGCRVEGDDIEHQFGDPNEERLKVALDYRELEDAACPSIFISSSASNNRGLTDAGGTGDRIILNKSVWQQNRIVTRPR